VSLKTIISYIVGLAVVFAMVIVSVIPWPSAGFILLGLCDSSMQYIAGECSVNTFNWDWCATDKFVRQMRSSECTVHGGRIFFSEAQALEVHQRLAVPAVPAAE
jgi:hypothetical protein